MFDLDGTLVAGDSFAGFVRALVMRSALRRVVALVSLPAWLPALLLDFTRLTSERFLLWLAAAGMDDEAFAAAARDFAAEHAGPIGGRTAGGALERVRAHRERGDRVIVATGCAAPLAQEICAVIGLEDVELVCSTVTRRRWGPPIAITPARGEGKLAALRGAGIRLPVDHAYSDSAIDLPLLRSARAPHVVDPSPRDWRRLRRALGPDVDLLRWATPAGARRRRRLPTSRRRAKPRERDPDEPAHRRLRGQLAGDHERLQAEGRELVERDVGSQDAGRGGLADAERAGPDRLGGRGPRRPRKHIAGPALRRRAGAAAGRCGALGLQAARSDPLRLAQTARAAQGAVARVSRVTASEGPGHRRRRRYSITPSPAASDRS